jgi:hypothetical protein
MAVAGLSLAAQNRLHLPWPVGVHSSADSAFMAGASGAQQPLIGQTADCAIDVVHD